MGILADLKAELRSNADGFVVDASDILDESFVNDELDARTVRAIEGEKMQKRMQLKHSSYYVPGDEAVPEEFLKGMFRGRSSIQPVDRQAGRGRVMGQRGRQGPGYPPGFGSGYGAGYDDGASFGY